MILVRYRANVPRLARLAPLAAAAMALLLADCAGLGSNRREEREGRINVFPDAYKADIQGAMHAYLANPTGIRDAYLSDPAIRQIGGPNRYTACVRFNSKNSDGRYTGSRDVMAVFVSGRFDQFVDPSAPPAQAGSPSNAAVQAKEACAQAEYKPFPELQTLTR
jgi:hypothetical protein